MKRMVMRDCIEGGYLMNGTFSGQDIINRLGQYEDIGYNPNDLKYIVQLYNKTMFGDATEGLAAQKEVPITVEKKTESVSKIGDTEHLNRNQILKKAAHAVSGQRVQDYGRPEKSFSVIASLWEPFIKEKCLDSDGEIRINGEDVAAMMVLFKLARVATGHGKMDNWVDACGYAACAGELQSGGTTDGVDENEVL